jgi:aryl-alcohol dehydrogenase-like predicted oxidoreductase
MYVWQFAKMLSTQQQHGWARFETMQNHYNLVYREEEREMIPFCLDQGIPMIPWSPLARGFLAGNRKRGEKAASLRERNDGYGHSLYYADADYDVADRVAEVAKQKGVLPIQVALAWVLSKPGIAAPIISATKLEQLDQLVAGVAIKLSKEEMQAVEAPYQPHRVLGHDE